MVALATKDGLDSLATLLRMNAKDPTSHAILCLLASISIPIWEDTIAQLAHQDILEPLFSSTMTTKLQLSLVDASFLIQTPNQCHLHHHLLLILNL